jgi:hypothetical protein
VSQLNIHGTPSFERALRRLMRLRKLSTKSEAVRIAVEEAAARAERSSQRIDFSRLRGAGQRAPMNRNRRFASHDDLWR